MKIQLSFQSMNIQTFQGRYVKSDSLNKAKLREYLESGLSVADIAQRHEVKPSFINYLVQVCDLTPEGLKKIQDLEAQIVALKKQRFSNSAIVKQLGIPKNLLKKILENLDIKKMNQDNVFARIEQIPKEDLSPQKIKEEFGYTKGYAQRVFGYVAESTRTKKRKEMCDKILKLQAQNYSVAEIAKELNRSEHCIRGYIKYLETLSKS